MFATDNRDDGGNMRSGQINRASNFVDVVEVLTGSWNEYDSGSFHVVVTPFFTVLTATLDAGSTGLPFMVTMPVAGTISHADGSVEAVIIRPGQTAVSVDSPGIFQMQMFGEYAKVANLLSNK